MPPWNARSAASRWALAALAAAAVSGAACRTLDRSTLSGSTPKGSTLGSSLFAGPSEHPPYASHSCEQCHDVTGKAQVEHRSEPLAPPSSGQEAGAPAEVDERLASLLLLRADELCFHCHAQLSPAQPRNRGKWLHGPFQAGLCLGCHLPHESSNPRLLRTYPWEKLCAECHPGFHGGKGAAVHPGECRSCHSPHEADKPYPGAS